MSIYHLLASDDWRQRQQAIESAAQLPDAHLAQVLIDIVRKNHEDLSALNAALQVLRNMGRAPVQELIDLLTSDDEQVRIYVPQILGQLGDERAIPALIKALDDSNANVRFNAIEALSCLNALEAVDPLIRRLSKEDLFTCYAAVIALGEIGAAHSPQVGSRISTVLMPLMSEEYLAEPVVIALGNIGHVEAVPIIFDWLGQPFSDPRVALTALARIVQRNPEAQPISIDESGTDSAMQAESTRLFQAIEDMLVDPNEKFQDENIVGEKKIEAHLTDAAVVLGWLYPSNPTHPQLRKFLVRLLAYPPARQPAEAALSAGPLPAPPELIAALSDSNIEFACTAAHVLAALRDPSALYPLIDALESEDRILSAHAAQALGKMGLPEGVQALVEHLDTSEVYVRQAVMNALAQHPSPVLTSQLLELLSAENSHQREAAVRLLVEANDERAANAVFTALSDEDLSVRKAAVEVLPRVHSPKTASVLEQVLKDPDAGLRASAARALALLPPDQAVPLLARAVNDPDGWVRTYACRSFGKLAHPGSVSFLLPCLADPLPLVRLAAVEAVGQIDASTNCPHLLPLLQDPEEEVRMAVQRYCGPKELEQGG